MESKQDGGTGKGASPPFDDHIAVVDLADKLQVSKQTVFKVAKRLGIRTAQRRESARGNQLIATLTSADAATIREELSTSSGISMSATGGTEDGVFYVIQLEPNHDPGRIKVGFTTDLEGRFRKHRCSAPFAVCVQSWPCRRVWERAVIDCVAAGLEQLHTEVFRCEALEAVVQQAEQFFSLMPPVDVDSSDAAGEPVSAAPARPRRRPKLQHNPLCRPSALAPFFWLTTHQIARNQSTNGMCVPWKIVPAVTDA